jgi:D-alanyl-D-alanine carboxypeptidase
MMPPEWSAVTVREMLNHTSGLPDYTRSAGFRKQAMTNPRGYVSPTEIIDWVRQTDWSSRRARATCIPTQTTSSSD